MRECGFKRVSAVLGAGVYALVAGGEVVFVGKAKGQVLSKLYGHRYGGAAPAWMPIKGFVFDEVWVLPCKAEELAAVEARIVKQYRPKYNRLPELEIERRA